MIKIGIVDDHVLIRRALSQILAMGRKFRVVLEAGNGKECIEEMAKKSKVDQPDILLMDVNMPELNGIEATRVLAKRYPELKIVGLSMLDGEETILDMLKAGARAYLTKDLEPGELEELLSIISKNDYYYGGAKVSAAVAKGLHGTDTAPATNVLLTEKEKQFLQHACSDLSYKEIAARMYLSERTIDGYRDTLFNKLKVSSRVGLAMEAIRQGLVTV